MSSTADIEPRPDALRVAVSELLARNVVELTRIGGGRNSQVYKAVDATAQCVAVKVYFRHPADDRDRLATEFNSLTYLREHGIRVVPGPIAAEPKMSLAVYEFIEGEKIEPAGALMPDLIAAIEFLGQLSELSRLPESRRLGPASEACFCPRSIVENIQRRVQRFSVSEGEDETVGALRAFLTDKFEPALERMTRWSRSHLEGAGASFDRDVDFSGRTLSPSDFGFHNAIRQRDGSIIFLDLEYFGWDDPAKMIADFLLHPAMSLSSEQKKKFTAGVLDHFSDYPGLLSRVEGVYPLFGLKWCLIFLNEFLPDPFLRRQFAAATGVDRPALQRQQLEKARQMLLRVNNEYECFPYHG
jgi:hypothetical protein